MCTMLPWMAVIFGRFFLPMHILCMIPPWYSWPMYCLFFTFYPWCPWCPYYRDVCPVWEDCDTNDVPIAWDVSMFIIFAIILRIVAVGFRADYQKYFTSLCQLNLWPTKYVCSVFPITLLIVDYISRQQRHPPPPYILNHSASLTCDTAICIYT